MQILGNPEVIANFLRKQQALDRGEKATRPKTARVVPGGGTAGIITAGMLQALHEVVPDASDVDAGVSVGAINLYNDQAGDIGTARFMYPLLVKAGLLSGKGLNKHFKIEMIAQVLRHRGKQQQVLNHRSDFVVYVTEFASGEGIGIDAKRAEPDIVEAVIASCMLPGMCSGTVHLGNKEYVDGACGMPFPVRHIIKKYRPTDILILLNRELPQRMGWLTWYLFPIIARRELRKQGVPKTLRDSLALMDHVIAHEIRLLMRDRRGWRKKFKHWVSRGEPLPLRKTIRWCIIAPEPHEAVPYDCTDVERLKKAGECAYNFMKALLTVYKRKYNL